MKSFVIAAAIALLIGSSAIAQDTHVEQNKAVVRKAFSDVLSRGNYEVAAQIYSRAFVNHGTTKDLNYDENITDIRGWRSAFPDLEMVIEKEVAEGDFVTVLWKGRGTNTGSGNGLNATGKKAEGRGISIFRVVAGKITDEWTEYSQMLIMRQLGLLSGTP